MKQTKFIILFLLTFLTTNVVWGTILALNPNLSTTNDGIQNGWYYANVHYSNQYTGTYADYTLNVKVEDNRVIAIDFGNNGSVHTGFNNEGYYYSGGNLSFKSDYGGAIKSASTTITISDSNGYRSFRILIE